MRETKKNKFKRGKRQNANFEGDAFFRLCQLLLAALLLYVTASLFAIGVGELGQGVASGILRYAGGGVILILLHFFYGLFCSLLHRSVYSVWSQWLGTFCLYAAISLFLGILQSSGMSAPIGLLSPGYIGYACSAVLPRFIGAVGTMLFGLCLVFLSAFNYGHLSAARVARYRERLAALFARRDEYPPSEEFTAEDEPVETEADALHETGQEEVADEENPCSTAEQETERGEKFTEENFPLHEAERDGAEEPHDLEQPLADPKKTGLFAAFSYLFGAPSSRETANTAQNFTENADAENFTENADAENFAESSEAENFTDGENGDDERREYTSPYNAEAEGETANENIFADESRRRSEREESESYGGRHFAPAAHETERETVTQAAVHSTTAGAAALTKNPSVEIDPSGALNGTEDVEFIAGRKIPANSFPPPLDLLGPHQDIREAICDEQAQENGRAVIASLADFGVSAELKRTIIGPTVVQYQIQLAPGIKVSKVSALGNDIAVALGVPAIRVEAPIQGTSYIGIELPNANRRAVPLRQIIESDVFQKTKLNLPLPLGQTVDGRILLTGLEELPHLLIAGTTGSGKSIFVNNCIVAMCYHNSPADLRFIMVDPKRVEMGIYESLPHILAKPIATATAAVHALAWAVREMDRRYDACSQMKVRNLASYNEKVLPKDRLPHIVIIVDELADLMMTAQKEVEDYIMRLAQMARAVGIHLMLATQRPSVNVLTGTIKANIPARISFSLPSIADSRTILDVTGAQNLLGRGDMLFVSTKHPHPLRIQSPFIDEQTNIRVVEYLRNTFGDPEYVDLEEQGNEKGGDGGDFLEDSRLEEAIKIVLSTGVASSSGLQRQMRVGFTRAARMIDTMEAMGIVGPQNGAKPREILVDEGEALEILEQHREG